MKIVFPLAVWYWLCGAWACVFLPQCNACVRECTLSSTDDQRMISEWQAVGRSGRHSDVLAAQVKWRLQSLLARLYTMRAYLTRRPHSPRPQKKERSYGAPLATAPLAYYGRYESAW